MREYDSGAASTAELYFSNENNESATRYEEEFVITYSHSLFADAAPLASPPQAHGRAAPSPRSEAAGVAAAPQRRDPTERLLQLQRTRRVMMTEYL